MKKITLSIIICVGFLFTSCKPETKKESIKIEKKAAFLLKEAENIINFTAYKTTDKVGVNGQFKKVNIVTNGSGNSIKEAINNTEFSIPVSSIFTKDDSRDFKIQNFFFKIMKNSALLSGKLFLEDDTKGYANITMNGVTKKLPFTYTIIGKEFKLNGTLNISNWQAEKALNSLNEACKDLHKGTDGISKTWDDVAINITSVFK